jgi:hypothetical protein
MFGCVCGHGYQAADGLRVEPVPRLGLRELFVPVPDPDLSGMGFFEGFTGRHCGRGRYAGR